MFDPARKGKKRDLRRGLDNGGFNPHRYYDRLIGDNDACYHWGSGDWHVCYNHQLEYVRNWIGCDYWNVYGHDHAPAYYRRMLNRQHRARCKAAMDRAIRDWDWDNYLPPKKAEDADWNWF